MAANRKKQLRSLRKARHGWFDYEVLDNFGDELGPFGCMVYMVLARFCYGGTRVCMSLREMAEHARMGKDKVSDSLAKLVELGLILETKGPTSRSPSCFDLLDVKDLVDEIRAKGRSGPQSPPSVVVADSGEGEGQQGAQATLAGLVLANLRANAGDSSAGILLGPAGIVVEDRAGDEPGEDANCLPERQLSADGENSAWAAPTVAGEGQHCLPQRTKLSAPADAFNKKERKVKEEEPPYPPQAGGVLSTVAASAAVLEEQEQDLAREAQPGERWAVTPAAKRDAELAWATATIMREHGMASDRRIEQAVYEALELWCSKTGNLPAAAVELEMANYKAFTEQSFLMTHGWGWRWWFKRGFWAKPEVWPYDQERLRQRQQARVGRNF